MMYRIVLVALTVFWLTMNVLLWRTEYGRHDGAGSAIPAGMVWQKVLTAPDSSSLSVFHHGIKIGFGHWSTSVGEELAAVKEDAPPPEGLLSRPQSYRLQLEGNLILPAHGTRVRIEGSLKLGRDKNWQDIFLKLNVRPTTWEIRSRAAERVVHLKVEDDRGYYDRDFKFSELQNPAALIEDFGGSMALGWLSGLGLPQPGVPEGNSQFALNWDARHDSVRVGHSLVRAYRLHTQVLERYQAVIFVSRVGEILRVELPDELVLVNDQLANF